MKTQNFGGEMLEALNEEALKGLYREHLSLLKEKCENALKKCELDAFIIASGQIHMKFLDDQSYPFQVNPHFLHFVPLQNHPNSFIFFNPERETRPTLLYFAADDFWHKPPASPSGFWTSEFNIKLIKNLDEAKAFFKEKVQNINCAYIGEGVELVFSEKELIGHQKGYPAACT